jgi:hypothetical protein
MTCVEEIKHGLRKWTDITSIRKAAALNPSLLVLRGAHLPYSLPPLAPNPPQLREKMIDNEISQVHQKHVVFSCVVPQLSYLAVI